MAVTAKQLREERAKLIADARKVLDKAEEEKRELNTEERAQWDRVMGGVDAEGKRVQGEEERLKVRIDQLERMEGLEGELRRVVETPDSTQKPGREDKAPAPKADEKPDESRDTPVTNEDRAYAIQGWMWAQRNREMTPKHKKALEKCREARDCYVDRSNGDFVFRFHDDYHQLRQELRGTNAQATTVNTLGGYLVPSGFVYQLEAAMLQFGGIRRAAKVLRTASGADLQWPTVNDTTNKGRILSENAAIATKDVTYGAITFHAYKYTSDLVLIPSELVEDSAFKLANELGRMLGERIGRITADHFTTGDAAMKPKGVVTAATLGVTTATGSAITTDEIYGLKHSVDPAYRMGAGFMMHDSVMLYVKKLKDGMGRPLFQSSLAGGAPDTLDGDPITINQSMASSVATTNKTMLYGDYQKYMIRDVAEVRLRRLVERYADLDQEGYVLFSRHDGNLLDAGVAPVKYMLQA